MKFRSKVRKERVWLKTTMILKTNDIDWGVYVVCVFICNFHSTTNNVKYYLHRGADNGIMPYSEYSMTCTVI